MSELTHKEISSRGGKANALLHKEEMIERLSKKFDGLTEDQRKAFMSGVRSGKTYAQIREELDISPTS